MGAAKSDAKKVYETDVMVRSARIESGKRMRISARCDTLVVPQGVGIQEYGHFTVQHGGSERVLPQHF